jgi:hypothetical protein
MQPSTILLHSYTITQLHYNCTTTALQLHYNCTTTALQMHYNCTTTALQLHYNCTTTALQLHYNCTTTALQLHYNSVTQLIRVHNVMYTYSSLNHITVQLLYVYTTLQISYTTSPKTHMYNHIHYTCNAPPARIRDGVFIYS